LKKEFKLPPTFKNIVLKYEEVIKKEGDLIIGDEKAPPVFKPCSKD
jgi:hypothetical protein